MVDAIGSGKVKSVAKSKPTEGGAAKKSKPTRGAPPEASPETSGEERRLGATIDERC